MTKDIEFGHGGSTKFALVDGRLEVAGDKKLNSDDLLERFNLNIDLENTSAVKALLNEKHGDLGILIRISDRTVQVGGFSGKYNWPPKGREGEITVRSVTELGKLYPEITFVPGLR
jgi:hypothetical protein